MPRRGKKLPAMSPSTRDIFRFIREDKVAEIKELLKKHEDLNLNVVDTDNPTLPTPLLVAAQLQNHAIVRLLLRAKRPAKVNVENTKGVRPIWYAAIHSDNVLADLIVNETEEKCDVNFIDKQSGCTPLFQSILSNSTEVCQILLHAGADVNMRRLGLTGDEASAQTPLIKAVQMDNAEICEMLLNSMCKMNAKTSDGFTALHYAVSYRRYNIANILLENRIKIHAKSHKGVTAMTLAIYHHLPAMCKLLLEFGYDSNRSFQWDEEPLEMAIRIHSESCALTLLHWGCGLQRPKKAPSFFKMAVTEGLLSLAKMLVDVNPLYLNETWIGDKNVEFSLYKKPEFRLWLQEASKTPPTLSHWCRVKIRNYLGKYPCAKIDKLPLPSQLIKSMSYSEFIVDKMYKQETIFDADCPYDCFSVCKRPQCPSIEFSDSGSEFSSEEDV